MFGRKKTREVEPVRRLFQNDALEVSVLSVIIALPADAMTPFLSLGGDGRGQVQIVTASRNVRELEADVARVKPRIVVLHTKTSGYSPDVVRRIVDSAHGRVAVIVIGRAGGEWEVEAREAGAVAVYPEPVDEATVDRFVEEAPGLVDEIELRRGQLHADAALSEAVLDQAAHAPVDLAVIACWSTKGGDGKTTVAVNLSYLLTSWAQQRGLLIDCDMNGGSVAINLGQRPETNTLLHLAADYQAADNRLSLGQLKKRVLSLDTGLNRITKKPESRLDVLFGLTQPEQASSEPLFGAQGLAFMRDLIRTAREHYRFVILDCGSNISLAPHTAALFDADLVYLITSNHRRSMFMNRDVMGSLVSKGRLDPAKFKLVLNRYRNDTSWDLPTIEAYMGLPVFGLIPASQKDALTEADNTGRPFVAAHMGRNDADDERVLKAFINLAGAVCEPVRTLAAERERKQRGLLGRIGKKP